jgi:hypothetical protein
MHIARENKKYRYYMNGQELEAVREEKDLGVMFTDDLKSSKQCAQAYTKANRVLGMTNRTITYKSTDILLSLYKTLVRPLLEYCTPVWSPHYKKDKILLEKIQHRFTRMLPHYREMSYEERLTRLGLWSLEERRNRAELIEVYKMKSGLTDMPLETLFDRNDNLHLRGHSVKLKKKRSKRDLRKYFFSERVVDRWNRLDQDTVDSGSVNALKNALQRIKKKKMGFFEDS